MLDISDISIVAMVSKSYQNLVALTLKVPQIQQLLTSIASMASKQHSPWCVPESCKPQKKYPLVI